MTLVMANALFFSSPFFVSIFAKFFLKEFIGIRRWSAIVFGFIGVYVVLNPNFSEFEYKDDYDVRKDCDNTKQSRTISFFKSPN